MRTMNISLPKGIKACVDQRVSQGCYGTSVEYVRELIRRDKDRNQLRAMMLKGLESPVAGQADAIYFQRLRKLAEQRKQP